MPIRNPFRRAGGAETLEDARSGAERGFFNSPGSGSKPVEIKEPTEYKLSEIDDNGAYLPPSPPERPGFWHSRSNASTTSSNHRSLLSENEPFSISRESFDSYRRSFDISARSPIPDFDSRPRQSLDARRSLEARRSLDVRRSRAPPRSSLQERRIDRPDESTAEEGFEEVGLNDEPKPAPKKRGIFARFGDSGGDVAHQEERPASSHHGFHLLPGRKRGQSTGQGSELKPISNGAPSASTEVPVETR